MSDTSSIGSITDGYVDNDRVYAFDFTQPISCVKKGQYMINNAKVIGQDAGNIVIRSLWKTPRSSKVKEVALRIVSKEPLGYETGRRGFGTLIGKGERAKKARQRAIETHRIRMHNEIAILSVVSHKNILTFYDYFESATNYYISTEYLYGTELPEETRFSEDKARIAARSILSGIAHLQSEQIVHRDIRPRNIRYKRDPPDNSELVITGFRYARKLENHRPSGGQELDSDYPEDARYSAPETFKGHWRNSSDVWSFGIVLYMMLTGRYAYGSTNDETSVSSRIESDKTIFDEGKRRWKSISEISGDRDPIKPALEITKLLLDRNPKTRITAEEALQHEWFHLSHSSRLRGHRSGKSLRSAAGDRSSMRRGSTPGPGVTSRSVSGHTEAKTVRSQERRADSPGVAVESGSVEGNTEARSSRSTKPRANSVDDPSSTRGDTEERSDRSPLRRADPPEVVAESSLARRDTGAQSDHSQLQRSGSPEAVAQTISAEGGTRGTRGTEARRYRSPLRHARTHEGDEPKAPRVSESSSGLERKQTPDGSDDPRRGRIGYPHRERGSSVSSAGRRVKKGRKSIKRFFRLGGLGGKET